MAPKLSPKKSIEGAVGGVLGSALLTALYCFIFRNHMNIDGTEIAILAVIAAVAGPYFNGWRFVRISHKA